MSINPILNIKTISKDDENLFSLSGVRAITLYGTFFYHRDHQGSIIALSDEHGDVVERLEYDEHYGRIIKHTKREDIETLNPYGYTGREIETDELYYYRARYYDAETQRFISLDPIGFASGDFNFYRYVGNSPVGFVDPSGLDKVVFYYKREGQEEFEKAGRTRANEYQGEETVHLIPVTTENDFRQEWNKLAKNKIPISEATIFSHGTYISLEFKPVTDKKKDGPNNGSMLMGELILLKKLNFTKNATLDIRSCVNSYNSEDIQKGRDLYKKVGWKLDPFKNTVAGLISETQHVTTIGMQGFGMFSTNKDERTFWDKLSIIGDEVYLDAFMNSSSNKEIPDQHLPENTDYKHRKIIPHTIYKNGDLVKK